MGAPEDSGRVSLWGALQGCSKGFSAGFPVGTPGILGTENVQLWRFCIPGGLGARGSGDHLKAAGHRRKLQASSSLDPVLIRIC